MENNAEGKTNRKLRIVRGVLGFALFVIMPILTGRYVASRLIEPGMSIEQMRQATAQGIALTM
jgi:hypothetical protein